MPPTPGAGKTPGWNVNAGEVFKDSDQHVWRTEIFRCFQMKRKGKKKSATGCSAGASVSWRQEAEAAFMFCLNDHHKASRAVSARDIVSLSDALLALHLRATVAFHFLPAAAAAIAASALDSVEFVFITKMLDRHQDTVIGAKLELNQQPPPKTRLPPLFNLHMTARSLLLSLRGREITVKRKQRLGFLHPQR